MAVATKVTKATPTPKQAADVHVPEPDTTPDTPDTLDAKESGLKLGGLPKLKPPNTAREHNIVVLAMFGTVGVLIIADIHKGKFPSARAMIALGFVFAGLAALTAVAPGIAAPLALLVFVGVLLNKGLGFFSAINVSGSDPSALVGTPQPAVDAGVYGSGYTPTGSGHYFGQQPSPKAERAVGYAKAAIGVPYVRGGTTRNGYDCSGLCYAAYLAAGFKSFPRTSEEQYHAGFQAVQWGDWAPGDLIFSQWEGDDTAPGHVVMYAGNGQCIAAPHTGATVEYEPVSTFAKPHYWGSVRPAPLAQSTRSQQINRRK
jgi:cell wall-associated NlpC family hydrolase